MRRVDLGLTGRAAGWTCREGMKSQSSCCVLFIGYKPDAAERWKGTTSMEHLLVQEPSERETGLLEAGGRGGHLETGWGTGGNKAELTHGRTHIQCSWSRSCRPSAHGQRRRFLWSYKPPCGSLRQPACQKPAPER